MAKANLNQIVDTALELASQTSWEAVRLHHIADRLDIRLEDIRKLVREKEDIVDVWFDRADQAMLNAARAPGFAELDSEARLVALITAWLDVLAPYRRVARQMIFGKLEPGHLHYQFQGAMRVSRTVQWMREAARREQTLPWRALDEVTLTTIYLSTFFYWMFDSSPDSGRTKKLVERKLRGMAYMKRWRATNSSVRTDGASASTT